MLFVPSPTKCGSDPNGAVLLAEWLMRPFSLPTILVLPIQENVNTDALETRHDPCPVGRTILTIGCHEPGWIGRKVFIDLAREQAGWTKISSQVWQQLLRDTRFKSDSKSINAIFWRSGLNHPFSAQSPHLSVLHALAYLSTAALL